MAKRVCDVCGKEKDVSGKWNGVGKWNGGNGKWCQALKIDITPFLLLSSPHGKTS